MLRGCTAGPPGSLCRALPAAAPAVRHRLRECAARIPEAGAVLDILEKCPESQRKGEFPVVVFEGLDATATETDGNIQNLPPDHDAVYKWPEDLLKPDLVLLLTVSPEERARRLEARGLEKTKEEAELEANSLFRQRIEESYRRMVNPACQEVDASPSKEEVFKTVLQLIKKHCAL
ncbi:hypothetical protein CIB84_005812 [Bambusicola thoracicus]|uniref:Thymidylate kinase-like domain-containing protein n=1 Tax=Bambusicola thoracicus TaxID=9083 RepID=A0A2P4T261_BAMTH|nr:hypothetical protein CIB84_005812 [Bambusicola thoracicus]